MFTLNRPTAVFKSNANYMATRALIEIYENLVTL